MKVGFNTSTNYQTRAYQAQNVSKCPSFKSANLEQARGLADLAVNELLAAERGGWESRRVEILSTLATIAEKRLGKKLSTREHNIALHDILGDCSIGSLPKRIFEVAKIFTKE